MHKLPLPAALLAATLVPLTAQSVIPEGAEPNDLNGTPTPCACGNTGAGVIDVVADTDAWAFSVTTATTIQLTVVPGFAGGLGDSCLELFDGTQTSIAFDDDGGDGLHSLLTVDLAPGAYYAVVSGYGGNIGSYTLDLVVRPPAASLCPGFNPIVEGPEPNDTAATATPYTACDQATGDITVAGDDDWYAFALANTTRCTFATGPGPNNPIADTCLELLDSAGNRLAFDDDGGTGLYSLIQLDLPAGVYYLVVDGWGSSTGDYLVTFDSFLHVVPAAYTVSGTACPDATAGTMNLAPRSNERPYAGSVFMIGVTGIPSSLASAVLGFIDMTPPVDLAIIGAPGCFQYTDIFIDFPLTVVGGSAEIQLAIPGHLPGLIGLGFNQQVVAIATGANSTGFVTSDFGEGTIGQGF